MNVYCICIHVCWRPEADFDYISWSFFTLTFKIDSLTKPGAPWFSWCGWPKTFRDPPVSNALALEFQVCSGICCTGFLYVGTQTLALMVKTQALSQCNHLHSLTQFFSNLGKTTKEPGKRNAFFILFFQEETCWGPGIQKQLCSRAMWCERCRQVGNDPI